MENFNGKFNGPYLVSEKFDGVCGIWDGHALKTRSDNEINAPQWWTKRLPKIPLIGELWIDRGKFSEVCSITRSTDAGERWRDVKYVIFDRIKKIEINTTDELDKFYKKVIANGGEGVVIEDSAGNLFKKKPVQDDDGTIVGYKDGSGRNAGKTSAFIIKLRDGREIGISNGLTAALRSVPPKIGSVIKFTFSGLTSNGLPRFASFAGVRAEENLNF